MSTLHTILVVVTALWVGFSAVSLLRGASWVVDALVEYGVPRTWWPWLGAAKAAGAVGLLAGLVVPAIGIAAAIGLVLYFLGAVVTILRARSYAHVPYPVLYLAPVIGTLAVGAAV